MHRFLTAIGPGRLIGIVLILAIAAGAVVAVPLLVSADDGGGDSRRTHDISVTRSQFSEIRIEGILDLFDDDRGSLHFEIGGPWHPDPLGTDLLETVAELTGAEVDDVVDALADGQSLAEFAEEHGVNEDELIDGLTAFIDEKLDEAVEDGDLPADVAERIQEEVTEHLEALINGDWPLDGFGFRGVPPVESLPFPIERGIDFKIDAGPIGITAELTGAKVEDVVAAMGEGQTLAEFAGERGVSADELVDAILERFQEQLDESVAEGDLDQEEADEILTSVEERVRELVNGEGFGFGFSRHHRFGPGERFMPFGGIFEFPGDCDEKESEETSNEI